MKSMKGYALGLMTAVAGITAYEILCCPETRQELGKMFKKKAKAKMNDLENMMD